MAFSRMVIERCFRSQPTFTGRIYLVTTGLWDVIYNGSQHTSPVDWGIAADFKAHPTV